MTSQDIPRKCGTCAKWQPPRTKYGTSGPCPYLPKGTEKYPEETCISWGWVQASKEQLESREKAGLI